MESRKRVCVLRQQVVMEGPVTLASLVWGEADTEPQKGPC